VALRGDITKWLQEINTGVYVGQSNARVRDELWKRITEHSKSGRATMVFNADNEQGLDFRVHNSSWEPVDYDGVKLMLRPCNTQHAVQQEQIPQSKEVLNSATGLITAQKITGENRSVYSKEQIDTSHYVVINIETTGLSAYSHELIEISALRVIDGEVNGEFHTIIQPKSQITPEIEALTGHSNESLKQGKSLTEALPEFLSFISNLNIVSHNTEFDYKFLRAACEHCGLPAFSNHSIDMISIAKKLIVDAKIIGLLHFSTILELILVATKMV